MDKIMVDYFLRNGHYETAIEMVKSAGIEVINLLVCYQAVTFENWEAVNLSHISDRVDIR